MTLRFVGPRLSARALALSMVVLAFVLGARTASAADDGATFVQEAGKHFERGVALYGEADYPGALVEFKRAYALSPNSAVLYNIGEAQYQLQDYASALATFSRYLAEVPSGAQHRAEVESNIEILRGRVGRMNVVTVPPGADVSVDDQPVGKTPLDQHVTVSVGHRKVTAVLAGHAPASRYVDVAADDDVSVALELPAVAGEGGTARAVLEPRPAARSGPSHGGSTLRVIGWIFTGAFAAGAAGAGALALRESNDLRSERNTYPVSASTLQGLSDRTRTYSILADSLAGVAVAVGSVTLISTVLAPGSRSQEVTARVRVSPTSLDFVASF